MTKPSSYLNMYHSSVNFSDQPIIRLHSIKVLMSTTGILIIIFSYDLLKNLQNIVCTQQQFVTSIIYILQKGEGNKFNITSQYRNSSTYLGLKSCYEQIPLFFIQLAVMPLSSHSNLFRPIGDSDYKEFAAYKFSEINFFIFFKIWLH